MDPSQRATVNRLKTARGHLNGVIAMVEGGAYCPDVMKQLSAVQGLVESASRIVLRRHLETCVATAMREGRTEAVVDELMETLKFDRHVFRPARVDDQDPEFRLERCEPSEATR
jgi:DNA-binding FrmR family transcriptional regulator